MNDFEFCFSFYGLLLGLAVAEVAVKLADAIGSRKKVVMGWLTPLLAVFILFDLAGFWMWAWANRNGLTVSWMLVLGGLIVAVTYFLAAALVFPRRPDEWPQLDEYYWQHKRFVVGGVIAANLVVTTFTFIRYPPGSHFWVWFFQIIYYGPLIALLLTKRRRFDVGLLAFLILSYFGAMLSPTSDWGAMTGL